ncbi:hypothetical protein D9M72_420830 [compost metagenome]
MEAHDLHQHLVGIGRAIEGAGARPVVGLGLCFEKLVAADLAFGEELAHPRLLVVREARGHRTCGHEDGGQMAEGQRRNDETRYDLVADAEIDGGIEHVVRQADAGSHGDQVAREERELHARLPLGDAIAHGRHTAGNLCDAARFARRIADERRIGLERLVRREHVIIGGDDAEIGHAVARKRHLLGGGTDGKPVR